MRTLSVVVPAVNEQARIGVCLDALRAGADAGVVDLVVVDGGSADGTPELAAAHGARVLASPTRGRAVQMNLGARATAGDVLYFVHADAVVPPTYAADVRAAVAAGLRLGGYRFRFDHRPSVLLRVNEWFTRFALPFCRGGDQTLFVERALFDRLGGYDERFVIMEEYDFLARAWPLAGYRVLGGAVVGSARKYGPNSWARVQRANAEAYRLFRRGAPPEAIRDRYAARLRPYLD